MTWIYKFPFVKGTSYFFSWKVFLIVLTTSILVVALATSLLLWCLITLGLPVSYSGKTWWALYFTLVIFHLFLGSTGGDDPQ